MARWVGSPWRGPSCLNKILYNKKLKINCQVGGGTLVVEPGEGRDPLTVNDQVGLKLFQFNCLLKAVHATTFPFKLMTYLPVLEIYRILRRW